MHVALVGPCSPVDVVGLMNRQEAPQARELPGYRGIPVSELAKNLISVGARVTVVSTDSTISAHNVEFSGPRFRMVVQRSRVRPRDYLHDIYRAERRGIASILRDVAPDIVHAHWTYEFELAAQDSGLPHVTTAHDAPFTILRRMRDPYRAARLLVALKARPGIQTLSTVAPNLAQRWSQQMRYGKPITVIPNSIPTDTLPAKSRPAKHPVVLDVADAGRLKNIPTLITAHSSVRSCVPGSELRLVGPGLGPEGATAQWAVKQGLAAGVTFVGKVSRTQLAHEYSRAWLFAHASYEEACPMTLLEAHGARLPIVGGVNSGGVPYLLDDGRAGWLTDVGDPRALASTIAHLLQNGPPAIQPGTTRYIEDNFTPQSVTEKYLAFYEGALAGDWSVS